MFPLLEVPTGLARPLFAKAQEMYGPAVAGWEFAGVTETANGPEIIYPRPGLVMIATTTNTRDIHQLLFQLGHEVIHLLSPDQNGPGAMMIEEGLAVKFSIEAPAYPREAYRDEALKSLQTTSASSNYREALSLLTMLEKQCPNAIRQLRTVEPHIHAWSPALLTTQLGISSEFASKLCERVQMRPRVPYQVDIS